MNILTRCFFLGAMIVSFMHSVHAQGIPANGCDPGINQRLQSAQSWALNDQLGQVQKAYAAVPASVGQLSCLKDLTSLLTMRTAFPSLANFTLTGNLADLLRRVVDRMLDTVEQRVCSKAQDLLAQFQTTITDLQGRILGGQVPGVIGIQPQSIPFRVAPRPDYNKGAEPTPPGFWDKLMRGLGL